jgi:hypothetical protein
MSESTFQELDLENLDPSKVPDIAAADDVEIVEEAAEQAPQPEPRAQEQAASDDDSEDDSTDDAVPQERKRLTRSQRLKAQRDLYAQQLTALQQEVHQLRASNQKATQESVEAANIGLDFYIQTLDSNMKALRQEFDRAFDAGDRDKIFDVQQKMAELAAEKKQAEREKRSIPTKAAPASGPAAPQQTPTTQQPTPTARPPSNPAAQEWATRNAEWFNKDRVMTAAAFAIDQQMVADGFDPSDPDYFEELDKRVRQTFPARFAEAPRTAKPTPTIQNKTAAAPTNGGKIKVVITSEDRRMADHLGLDIQTYAREKAKRERALQTATQYTEII